MQSDWQSWAAPVVVLLTLAAFLFRALRRRDGASGCDDCSCSKKS